MMNSRPRRMPAGAWPRRGTWPGFGTAAAGRGSCTPLDGQGEQLLVGRTQQVVVRPAVLEPEDPVAVFGPAVGGFVGPAAAAPETGSPGRRWTPFPRGRCSRSCAAPADPAATSCRARADRAHVSGPDQQLVAGNLASAGSSRRVRRNSSDMRVITAG